MIDCALNVNAGSGKAATDTDVEEYLSEPEEVEPQTGLKPEAVQHFEEQLGRPKQPR